MNFSKISSILNWSVRVGSLFGVPISLHITLIFFLLPALQQRSGLGLGYEIEYALGIVLSILFHEMGHALTAKHFKQTGLSIMLHGFGGFATSQGKRTPTQQLLIVLAGPAVNFVLGGILLGVAKIYLPHAEIGGAAFYQLDLVNYLGIINIMLGALNLIPLFPWDGGLAAAAIMSYRISEFKAYRHVCHWSLLLAPVLFIYGLVNSDRFFQLFGLVGFISSLMYLLQTGGIKFGEALADRRARKEEEAYKKRQKAKNDEYLGEVIDRAKEREEQERLRKLLG